MEGNISLKQFILGVKKELQEASKEGSQDPFLQLDTVELEAEFALDAKLAAEGKFCFFMKVEGETGGHQSHKVKLVFSPIKNNPDGSEGVYCYKMPFSGIDKFIKSSPIKTSPGNERTYQFDENGFKLFQNEFAKNIAENITQHIEFVKIKPKKKKQ